MMTNMEKKMGIVLNNTTKLVKYLKKFSGYNPANEVESAEYLQSLVDKLVSTHESELERANTFSVDLAVRQNVFTNTFRSLTMLANPMGATMGDIYGFGDEINRNFLMVIAGIKEVCSERPNKKMSESVVDKSMSTFGGIAQSFSELVNSLKKHQVAGSQEEEIDFEDLHVKLAKMNLANHNVRIAFSNLHTTHQRRNELYLELKRRIRSIKKAAKEQFGFGSVQYDLIQSLSI